MACEVCEHCDTVIPPDQETECQGHSYHSQCRKCYVCSETNLRDAEIFKGVIFCYECSKRIFQGCVTTRRAKSRLRSKSQKDRGHMKRKGHRRRVLEKLTSVRNMCDSSRDPSILSPVSKSSYKKDKPYVYSEEGNLKKSSTDKNISTVITQDLLEKLNQPTETGDIIRLLKTNLESSKEVRMKHKSTDLSVTELGASVEIAHIGLRHHSELPVIIKSVSAVKRLKSKSASVKKARKSDITTKSSSTLDHKDGTLLCSNRHVASVLKMPYKCFKRNILDRSSYISMMMRLEGGGCTRGTLRRLFHDEIDKHHRGGMKTLYSTINRTELPYKLGWLKTSRHRNVKRCKHYKESHSYRCLRSHVMRLAGPTSSELAVLRKKLKDFFTTDFTTKMLTKEVNSKDRTVKKYCNTCNITK